MTSRTLAVVTAGLTQPSSTRLLADRLAEATTAALRSGHGVEAGVEVIELRSHARDLTNNLLTFFASDTLQAAKDSVAAADGVIAVTPIFSASYSGLFKTFFDVLDPDTLAGTPVLIGATAGTPRHSLALEYALRPLFAYLKAVIVPTAVFASADDWGSADELEAGLAGRIDLGGAQLASLVAAPPRLTVTDPFEASVPFEELLDDADE